jgi:hypothetical protein
MFLLFFWRFYLIKSACDSLLLTVIFLSFSDVNLIGLLIFIINPGFSDSIAFIGSNLTAPGPRKVKAPILCYWTP